MKGNPILPPWSQPCCQPCYEKRFGEKTKIFSSWIKREFCFDCGAITNEGIYIDTRPASEREAPGHFGELEKKAIKWAAKHPEVNNGGWRGSAEDEPRE